MQELTKDPLLNLRRLYALLQDYYDEKEIDVLVWLLGNSPALDFMEVSTSPPREAGKYIKLLERILDSNFRRPSGPTRVCLT